MKILENTLLKLKMNKMYMIPLRDIVVFPNMVLPFFVGRKKSITAAEEALKKGRVVFLTTQKNSSSEEPSMDDIYQVGTVAKILQSLKLPDGTIRLLVEGYERASIVNYHETLASYKVQIKPIKDNTEITPEITALLRVVKSEFAHYAQANKKIPAEILVNIEKAKNPNKLVNLICANAPLTLEKKITLLEEIDLKIRLEKLLMVLTDERKVYEFEQKIQNKIRRKIEKNQKDYFLNEQLKEIKKELGNEADDLTGVKELEKLFSKKKLPVYVYERAEKEIKRLGRLQPMSPEAGVLRTYLEWIAELPWSETKSEEVDIDKAKEILDQDHYNLIKVKDRILDFLAVRQLKKRVKGPILCLVGPPGTGKTSLGRSVARALDRPFVRISLGGIRDEAEIRGHRRTYIGAMPGKIIQAMRNLDSINPVFLLDEIDKMSSDYRGDPSSALLEVLDPEQNNTFRDHYLEIPYDLSQIMFITTANSIHTIPYPLLDRMELIEISGYSEYEKLKIAEGFLLPKQIEENGLDWAKISFSEEAIRNIIRKYTRESGVRNLEREIAGVLRKIAREAVRSKTHELPDAEKADYSVSIIAQNLNKYISVEKYKENEFPKPDKPGLVYGMAWTERGGRLLPIEVLLIEGKGDLLLTGSLGDIMKESAQAAKSFLRANTEALNLDPEVFKTKDIHVHVPEGAIPKDGPSAGITLTASLYSALSGNVMKDRWAMTGEITLTGRILPVGGVKEKVLAAHRHGITEVLLPKGNESDLDELPDEARESLKFHFGVTVIEALKLLFHL
ncbi:MAG: endopeptidase La [Spirochaetales bacterium]|nr:endopeptidase La [Spirochaetales bacterium]